jgi:hypothetical protein
VIETALILAWASWVLALGALECEAGARDRVVLLRLSGLVGLAAMAFGLGGVA